MKFELAFNGATYRVAHAKPLAGESVVMEEKHLNPDGTLVPIPYLTAGKLMAVDCLGQQHNFVSGGEENTVFPLGRFSMIAVEDGDYWCTSPLPGYRIIREGRLIVPAGQAVNISKDYPVNALFTKDSLVNGTLVKAGSVGKLSAGQKLITQLDGEELHVIFFNTEPV